MLRLKGQLAERVVLSIVGGSDWTTLDGKRRMCTRHGRVRARRQTARRSEAKLLGKELGAQRMEVVEDAASDSTQASGTRRIQPH